MSKNELKTKAIVLRRTNIGEADRIVDFITPEGRISAKARSVRKEKSRLAGSIEMFCLSEITIYRNLKTNYNTLTSAKMLNFYRGILSDFSKLELASNVIQKVSSASKQIDSPKYFEITKTVFEHLDRNTPNDIITAWFYFNLAKARGEQINLVTDVDGEKLKPDVTYAWDTVDSAMRPYPTGKIHADEIKILRLMISSPLDIIARIENIEHYIPEVLFIAKSLNQL